MTVQDFERLKKQLETEKTKKIQAQARIDQIMQELKEKYSLSSIEEAEQFLSQLREQVTGLEEKKYKYMKELQGIMEC